MRTLPDGDELLVLIVGGGCIRRQQGGYDECVFHCGGLVHRSAQFDECLIERVDPNKSVAGVFDVEDQIDGYKLTRLRWSCL